jgi:transposase
MAIYDELPHGKSISPIQQETGYDRATIRRVQGAGEAGLHTPSASTPPPRPSLLAPYQESIRKRVQDGGGNTAGLFDAIREQGYAGGRSILKEFVQPRRPSRMPEPVRRYETPPGRQAPWDFAQCGTLRYPDGTSRPLWVFVMPLSSSRGLSVECVHDSRQDTRFTSLEQALAALGGGPLEIVSDNMSPMVLDHPAEGPVKWPPRFLDFARFHGFEPKAARPDRGQTQGKIERPMRSLRGNFWPRVRRIEG